METKTAFGQAFKQIRKYRSLTQEDFSDVSSRTYISIIERGEKAVTIEKLEELANSLNVHPVTLLALTYAQSKENKNWAEVLEQVQYELLKFSDN
jgi:transcriptional regulator with XRE-family HTH domain